MPILLYHLFYLGTVSTVSIFKYNGVLLVLCIVFLIFQKSSKLCIIDDTLKGLY